MSGGDRVADGLRRHGIDALFTLCGGHISPILVGARERGVRVIDVRHEATAVFAADAYARISGRTGVAAVTAGPGVTNTITALENARLAQSPLVLLGGASPTILRGKGSLQDIDQLAAVKPHVKWSGSVGALRELTPLLERAFRAAADGVPGPVFLELPLDLVYDETLVRDWYQRGLGGGGSLRGRVVERYVARHLDRLFRPDGGIAREQLGPATTAAPGRLSLRRAAAALARARRPVLVLGSQLTLRPDRLAAVIEAVERIGAPVYLSGMARGLLGRRHPLWLRHRRKAALRAADVVVLAGVPQDFRLDYGRHVSRQATLIAANRSWRQLVHNRVPTIPAHADPAAFLIALADRGTGGGTTDADWLPGLRARDEARDAEIRRLATEPVDGVHPLQVATELERVIPDDSVVVVDGGDFVASASYVVAPRGPLRWLDPGVFGTLGVGAGFAIGAAMARPTAQVWALFGDGAAGYGLSELDTFVRHGIGVVSVVGNDASWAQIAREQVEIFHDDVGTVLRRSDYHQVARGFGAKGYVVRRPGALRGALRKAADAGAAGVPALVNVHLGATDFRKGSISM